jgi:hypothetical protein
MRETPLAERPVVLEQDHEDAGKIVVRHETAESVHHVELRRKREVGQRLRTNPTAINADRRDTPSSARDARSADAHRSASSSC